MKKQAKRLCAAVLAVMTLMSMISFSSIAAFATETDVQSDEIEVFQGATGDLSLEDGEYAEDVEVIQTTDEYFNTISNGARLLRNTTSLPDSVDNSQSKYFPPIGSQGSIGSCVCWAQTYYQFSYTVNKQLDRTATYENSFSPKFTYNFENGGYDHGSTDEGVYENLAKNGAPSIKTVPYDNDYLSWSANEEAWIEAAEHKLKSYQYFDIPKDVTFITSADDSDLNTIKTALSNGDILTFSTCIGSWSYSFIKNNSNVPENEKYVGEHVVTHRDGYNGGHRMTLVGYNDNIWTDINGNNIVDDGEMGAFKIANSWGTNYCNDGFVWVAYDALNKVSAVKDVDFLSGRLPIIERISRIDIEANDVNSNIFLKYTLNSAARNQTPVELVAEIDGTEVVEYLFPYNIFSVINSDATYSYNGTTTAEDGTFMIELSEYLPGINSENITDYNISVRFYDTEEDSNFLTVKDVEVVDKNTGIIYSPANFKQLSLDGLEADVDVIESTKKSSVIYYRGYLNPNIHYKVGNGEWTEAPGVPMECNSEREGYTHKYVIELGENEDEITLCFNDGNGTYDNNNNKNYTAYEGLNYFVTENVSVPELSVELKSKSEEFVYNYSAGFEAIAEGGYAPYKYEFNTNFVDDGYLGLFQEYSDNSVYYSPLWGLGKAIVTVNVIDHIGNTATASFEANVELKETIFEKFSILPNDKVQLGTEIDFDAITEYEQKNYGVNNEFTFNIYRDGKLVASPEILFYKDYYVDSGEMKSHVHADWTPQEAGNYTAIVTVTDIYDRIATETLDFIVYEDELEIESFDISPEGKVGFFEIANMSAKAKGGTGDYTYQFSYKQYGMEYIIQDFSSAETASKQFGNTMGSYTMIVTAKDSAGNIATAQKTFTIIQTYLSALEVDNASADTGDTVKITPVIHNESSVIEPEHYFYTVTKDGVTQELETLSDKTASWTPTETGTYTIELKVIYQDTLVAIKTLNYEVLNEGLSIESFVVTPNGKGGYFEIANMSAKASGGTGDYTYRFSYKSYGKEYLIQDYSSAETASKQFDNCTGYYTMIVTVMDSSGDTATAQQSFNIIQTYLSNLEVDKESVNIGETVKITPVIYYEASVIKPEHYFYTVTKDGVSETISTLSDKTASWTPTEAGEYKIKLEVKYSDTLIAIKEITYTVTVPIIEDNMIYFVPSDNWKQDNARFAVYAWNDSSSIWLSLTETDGVYTADLGDGYSNVIFCRMNPSTTENNWNNKWNQTADLTIPEEMNCFTVNTGEWDGANGTWSYYDPTENYELGDVDLDGHITVRDATAICKYLVEMKTMSLTQFKLADVNGDGAVNVKDATYIQKMIVELV